MFLFKAAAWTSVLIVGLFGLLRPAGATTFLTESFEAAFVNGAPSGWTKQFKTGTVDWARYSGDHQSGVAHSGTYNTMLYSTSTSAHETYLVTPALNLAGVANATLEFWYKQAAWGSDQDTLTVCYRTASGGDWTPLASYTSNTPAWTKEAITLPNLTGTYYIGFLGNAKYGYGVCIDDVVVSNNLPAPTVTSITPNAGVNAGNLDNASLAGTYFQAGATVKLPKGGQADRNSTSVNVVSSTQITCTLSLSGAASGQWDVVVTNPDGQSATLAGGFTVGKVVYVATTGNDTNDGLSWATAKGTVIDGLATAGSGDQVWVAAGKYVGCITLKDGVVLYGGFVGDETQLTQRNWRANITVLDGNNAGSVVTAPSGATANTRIDGFTLRNGKASSHGGGIYCSGGSPTISNNTITGNSASSGGGGIYCDSSSPAISNNTITGNRAGHGGGVCGVYSSSPAISNNTISGNIASYGGGIFCSDGSPTISNNTITGNSASYGGGIYCDYSSPAISSNIVALNSSGLYIDAGTPTLKNNCVYNPGGANYTGVTDPTGTNGNISVDPQLLAVTYGEVHLKAGSPCIDTGLDSVVQPGWMDMDGQSRIQGAHVDIGADEFDGTTPPFTLRVVRVSPSGNDANDGSSWALAKQTVQAGIDAASASGAEVWVAEGIYNQRVTLKFQTYVYGGFAGTETSRDHRNWVANPTILDGGAAGSVVTASAPGYASSAIDGFTIRNGSASIGGGIYCSGGSPTISNNTITGNSASYDGGGIYCSGGSPAISNNTITGNSASYGGGGIYCKSSSPAISNNIVAFNSSGLYIIGGTSTLKNNCVYNPAGANYTGVTDPTGTNGNISADPSFLRSPSPGTDGNWATADDDSGNLHLKSGSPCIDAGDNSAVPTGILTDLDGRPRFFDDPATADTGLGTAPIVDMGAYEYHTPAPVDFNLDGHVDIVDLTYFMRCVSGPAIPYNPYCGAKADLDGDSDVDQVDFGLFQRCFSGTEWADSKCMNP